MLADVWEQFGVPFFWSIGITFALGILWEVADEVFKEHSLFDPRGWDTTDIFSNTVGLSIKVILRGFK